MSYARLKPPSTREVGSVFARMLIGPESGRVRCGAVIMRLQRLERV